MADTTSKNSQPAATEGRLKQGACELIYDEQFEQWSTSANWSANWLMQGIQLDAQSCVPVSHGGRGHAWFIELNQQSAVLRSYQRGGLVARINQQSYLGLHADGSRAFREWRLLFKLYNQGLPVPRPLAASCCRWPVAFSPLYRAHILVQRIPEVSTLDQLLEASALSAESWREIGRVIRQFHDAGVYHADLNANNVLMNKQGRVFLIDFDKSEIKPDGQWKADNLARLKRSLLKQQSRAETYYFSEEEWKSLQQGYTESTTG